MLPSRSRVVVCSLVVQKIFHRLPAVDDAVKRVILNSGYPRQQDREGDCRIASRNNQEICASQQAVDDAGADGDDYGWKGGIDVGVEVRSRTRTS